MKIPYEEVAARTQVWGRAFFMGPSGSGKSRGAFELATRMFGGELPVTYINTERDREKLYADRFTYSLINLSDVGDFSPETFVAALDVAESRNPGGVIILDSVSHEWMGEGGVLALADRFGEWKSVRPRHNAFVKRILACDAHVIAVCRAKMKYEVGEEERGGRTRQVISMLGVGPIQDDSMQYEFNLVGRFSVPTHEVEFSGHVDPLQGQVADMVTGGQQVAETYSRWLSEGTPIEAAVSAGEKDIAALRESLLAEGITEEKIEQGFSVARRANRGKLSPAYVEEKHAASLARRNPDPVGTETEEELEAALGDAKPADDVAPVAAKGKQGKLTPA